MPSESVVFVHGVLGSSHDWAGLRSVAVETVGSAFAPTMPGFGEEPVPHGLEITIDGYAGWLGEQIDEQGIDRAHLVMHDFGGGFGLGWGAAHPERVARVTLIDTGILTAFRWHALARLWRTPIAGEIFNAFTTRWALGLLLRRGQPVRLPRATVDRLYANFPPSARRVITRLYRASDEPVLSRFADDYRRLDPPTLVIWGAHDPYLPVEQAERQRDAFPSADVVVLPDSGHWPHLDHPSTVASLLATFLEKGI